MVANPQSAYNGEGMKGDKVKIIFTVEEQVKANFKIQLQYDSLTQAKFFRAIMDGYVNNDPELAQFLNKFKKKNSIQNNVQRKKVITNIKKAEEVKNKFALGDEEVENIFDILEKEYPEL